MELTRRAFLGGAAVFAAGAAPGVGAARPNLRLAVLSDIHVVGGAEAFEKALRYYDGRGVDAVLMAGDLADFGLIPQLEAVGRAWDAVFPGDRRTDGAPVEKLFLYGDHDMGGYMHKRDYVVRRYPDADALAKMVIPDNDPAALWRRVFHEDWAVIRRKTVKGYDFILGSFTRPPKGGKWRDATVGIGDWMAKWTCDPRRPFFFSQHRPIPGTLPYPKRQTPDEATRALARFPNAIAFTGHTHWDLRDERTFWRGGFTCFETSSLTRARDRLAEAAAGGKARRIGQCQLVDVYDDRLEVERLDAATFAPLRPRTAYPFAFRV